MILLQLKGSASASSYCNTCSIAVVTAILSLIVVVRKADMITEAFSTCEFHRLLVSDVILCDIPLFTTFIVIDIFILGNYGVMFKSIPSSTGRYPF